VQAGPSDASFGELQPLKDYLADVDPPKLPEWDPRYQPSDRVNRQSKDEIAQERAAKEAAGATVGDGESDTLVQNESGEWTTLDSDSDSDSIDQQVLIGGALLVLAAIYATQQ